VSLDRQPAISVIVPVYNIEHYVADCLDSLLAQSFDDFEIVIVNDGSTDGSARVIERYATQNPAAIRAFTKSNGGLSDARNYGMDRAEGAYFAFIDGDDTVAPNMLGCMHERALATGADLVICGIENFADGADAGVYYPEPDMSVFGRSLVEEPRLLYRVDASACDKLFARELFLRSGVRFPVGLRFEDVPTIYRLLPFARRIEKIDRPLYRYRHDRPTSISGGYDARYLDLVEGFRLIDDAYSDAGIFEANRGALLRLHLTHLIAGRYPDLFARASTSARRRFVAAAFELLDERFRRWRDTGVCRELWRNPVLRFISTHESALGLFCALPSGVYSGALARLGAFDPNR